ncbi:MAG: hypothetical protein OWT28_05005 [Firmicutes bacterium]|nr:hypothetical protein [Bacillota bacterium]
MQETAEQIVPAGKRHPALWLRVVSAVLMLVVAYIHLGLFLRMITFHVTLLGVLFGLNALAAVVAAVFVTRNHRLLGWILGSVVAGVAGIIRLAMDLSPSLSASILGSSGFRSGTFSPSAFAARFKGAKGFKGFAGGKNFKGHFPAGGFHGGAYPGAAGFHTGGLPAIPDAATISIIIEFVFVALAIYTLLRTRRAHATPSGTAASLN